jgi:bifunctional non-homologous end joining protein LigD
MLWRNPSPKRQPPGFIEPCIPTRADKPPAEPDWVHEIRVRLFTRRGYDWTDRFPLIREAVAGLRSSALVLDAEAVCCDRDGTANFELLHSQAFNDRVFLYAFDLLELGGVDLRVEPLEERKVLLQHLMRNVAHPGVRYNDHVEGDGATVFRARLQARFRGHRVEAPGAPYRSGPSKSWVKVKNPNYGSRCGE